MRKLIIFILLFFFGNQFTTASLQTSKQTNQLVLKVKVIGVKDGDTIEVLYYQLPIVIRLEHIDAPEKKQAFGTVSKQKLSSAGFNFNYFTNLVKTKESKLYYFCYEFGYLPLENEKILLVKSKKEAD